MSAPVIVAITGASGATFGIRSLEILRRLGRETHLVLSPAAKVTIHQETELKVSEVQGLASVVHDSNDIGASIASGSFRTDGMLIAPCSIKTLSAVANCYAEDLIARAADVCLKEGRPLLLMVRETPLHPGHLHLMQLASQAGAILFPPVPSFYDKPQSLDEMVTATVGRALQRMGIDNDVYRIWHGL